MSAEIQAACRDAGQPVPESDAELARCIFDSLALLYARVLNELAALRGSRSASCISSAAAARTRCSTSCAPTPAASPSWPAR
jgi:sugar (pentulose or hexulose) kinase